MGKAVAVEQVDPNTGEVIAMHASTHAAASAVGKEGGAGNILNVANGKSKSAYGYIWRFPSQDNDNVDGLNDEEWAEFQGVQVSSHGRIRRTNAAGKTYVTHDLPVVTIAGKQWAIHRLVAHVFLGMPDDPSITVKVTGNVPSVKNITILGNKKRKRQVNNANPKAAKKVQQWSRDGSQLLNEYVSVSDAARQLHMSTTHICKCASGKEKTAGGYTWKYVSLAPPM